MNRIKMHISKAKLPFYQPCEVKCGLQNEVSTATFLEVLKEVRLGLLITKPDVRGNSRKSRRR